MSLINNNALCLLPFNLPRSVHSMLIINPDYKTKSVLSAYYEQELNNWSWILIIGPSKYLLITKNWRVREEKKMNNFSMTSSKKSLHEHKYSIKKISFKQQAKSEILFPNNIVKSEVSKGTIVLCLPNNFFTNINQNLKDLQKILFRRCHYSLKTLQSWYALNSSSKDVIDIDVLINCCQIRRVKTLKDPEGLPTLGARASTRTNGCLLEAVWITSWVLLPKRA